MEEYTPTEYLTKLEMMKLSLELNHRRHQADTTHYKRGQVRPTVFSSTQNTASSDSPSIDKKRWWPLRIGFSRHQPRPSSGQ